MLLAILLGLQILGNFLMCVESIDDLEEIDVSNNEVDIDRRIRDVSNNKVDIRKRFTLESNKEYYIEILLNMYDAADFDTFRVGNQIPDARCHLPFIIRSGFWNSVESSANGYCQRDSGTNSWCSETKVFKRGVNSQKWKYCLKKGKELADPKKWKPHSSCEKLFAHKKKYFKGCTNIDGEKPWCAHVVRYISGSGKWSNCINIEKKWAEWSSWSECPQTCDKGNTTRNRQCLQTGKPSSGCPGGISTEQKSCNPDSCSINGGWSEWSHGNCSVTCGAGIKTKTRECNKPKPKFRSPDCDTDNVKKEHCQLAECPSRTFVSGTTSNIRMIILYACLSLVGLASVLALIYIAYNKNLLEKIKGKFGKSGKLSSKEESPEVIISNFPSLYADE